jgi:hypothetical protein
MREALVILSLLALLLIGIIQERIERDRNA